MTFEVIGHAPSAIGEVTLRRRDSEAHGSVVELRVNGVFVMDTAQSRSESRLAELALAHHRSPTRVLVGGLGLGYTAVTVLTDPRVRQLDVVEIAAPLLEWAQQGLLPNSGALQHDDRCQLHLGDIGEWVQDAAGSPYDLILLDVDNGPGYLVHQPNEGLYRREFLSAYMRALSPDGVLAIWAAQPAEELAQQLQSRFEYVITEQVAVSLGGRPDHYFIYLARRSRQNHE